MTVLGDDQYPSKAFWFAAKNSPDFPSRLSTYRDLADALSDFAKNNPTFPRDLVCVQMDTEVMETVEGEKYWLEYRASDDSLTLNCDISYPCSWDEFEVQLAEFWDRIDFWENPVEELTENQ